MGVAYKGNINDDRESPAYKLINILIKKYNCKISYHDPFIKKVKILKIKNFNSKSVSTQPKLLQKFDFGILVTDHKKINYLNIMKNMKLIFDTKNLKNFNGANIIKI